MTRIRELRNSRGISQNELAKALGIKQQSLCKYEKGVNEIKLSTLIQIADYFHTTLDFLANHTIPKTSDYRFMVCEENLSVCNLKEAHLLHLFRQIPSKYQDALISFLDMVESPEGEKIMARRLKN